MRILPSFKFLYEYTENLLCYILILLINVLFFQLDAMNTKELFRRILYTVLSFLYINGDSEFSLNNDAAFDYIGLPPQTHSQNKLFNKPGLKKSLSNFRGLPWPYLSGPGRNANVLIPPMTPTFRGGIIGPPSTGIGPPVEGIINKWQAQGMMTSSVPDVATGQKSVGQQKSISHQLSGQAHFSGAWEGGSWKGLPPLQPGAAPYRDGQSIPRRPTYGYKEPALPQLPMTMPVLTPPITSLPIPGTLQGPFKQPDVQTEPVHGLPLNYLYAHIPMVPAVTGVIGGGFSGEFM